MIIVTGAGGFIGSNMVADLVVEGRGPVAVSDYWGTGNKCEKLTWCYVSGFVRLGELLDFVRAGGDRISAIVHMGAISATTVRDIDKLSSHNIHATVDLWDHCAAAGIPFLYASPTATYGVRPE